MKKQMNFGREYDNKYLVVINGNEVVYSNCNKKPALRFFKARQKFSTDYVEFWYQYSDTCILLDFCN